MLTKHLRLAPRLRIPEAIPLLPHMPSWCKQGQIYLTSFIEIIQAVQNLKCHESYGEQAEFINLFLLLSVM
jgi:hypothetical protein